MGSYMLSHVIIPTILISIWIHQTAICESSNSTLQEIVSRDRTDLKICKYERLPAGWDSCSSKKDFVTPEKLSVTAFQKQYCFCDDNCFEYGDCCADAPVFKRNFTNFDDVTIEKRWQCRYFSRIWVYMFQMCPASWKNSDVRELCEVESKVLKKNGRRYTHLQDIPVYNEKTNLVYRNVFCAVCNGDNRTIKKWNLTFICYDMDSNEKKRVTKLRKDAKYIPESQEWIVQTNDINFTCVIESNEFIRIRSGRFRPCRTSISSCPANYTNITKKKRCEAFASFTYGSNSFLDKDVMEWKRYSNFYCALCNGMSPMQLKCTHVSIHDPFTRNPALKSSPWYPLLLDFNFMKDDNNWVGGSSYCSNYMTQIYDPLMKSCFDIHCGRFHYLENGRCIPFDDEIPSLPPDHINESLGLYSDCPKVKLSKDNFTIIDGASIYVNSSGTLYTRNDYEIVKIENGSVSEILVCYNGENLYHLSLVQRIISEISLCVSILSLILHIFVYLSLPSLRNVPGKVVICLSFTLLIAHISFLAGTYSVDVKWLCMGLAITAHFSYLCSFFWTNVMAFDIWRTFGVTKSRNLESSRTLLKYSLYAWWCPIVIVLFAVVFDSTFQYNPFQPYYGLKACWISQRKGLLVFFAIPLGLLLSANFSFFFLTAHSLHAAKKQTKLARKRSSDNENRTRFFVYVKLVVIMGLTWIFGFIASLTGVDFLWYPFIILNGLQGFFIFLSFTLTQIKVIGPKLLAHYGLRKSHGYLRAKTGDKADDRGTRSKYTSSTCVSSDQTGLSISKSDLSKSNVSLSIPKTSC